MIYNGLEESWDVVKVALNELERKQERLYIDYCNATARLKAINKIVDSNQKPNQKIDGIKSLCSINHDKLYAQRCDAIRAWNRRAEEPITEEDYTELRDRFGEYVEFVVRDMITGKGERWTKINE